MRHLLDAVQRPDVVKSVNAGRQATVQTEDLVVDECGQREVVEKICEVLPDIGVAVLAEALVVEAVDLSNLPGLVVTSENRDALRVANLESYEEGNGLDRVVASVDIVA
jgi:hypothetical protein